LYLIRADAHCGRKCIPEFPCASVAFMADNRKNDLLKQELLKKVECAAEEHGLFRRGSSIVLAVSGGADSVCMAHLFSMLSVKMQIELHVAHFDHCLRGAESLRDAEFTEKLARELGLPFTRGRGNTAWFAEKRRISTQEAARILRYRFLDEVRGSTGFDLIATAHTADDQAEELLARIIRGCGLQGLAGIPWKRGDIIRPMLGIYSREIRAFLDSFSISHVEDSSNRKRKYLRNRIRLDLIPYITENFNPALKEGLNRTASLLADDMQVMEAMAADAFAVCISDRGSESEAGYLNLSCEQLVRYYPALRRRVYRMAIEQLGGLDGNITSVHLNGIDRLVTGENPSAEMNLPHGIKAARRYTMLTISMEDMSGPGGCRGFELEISRPGGCVLPHGCGEIKIEEILDTAEHCDTDQKFPRALFLSSSSIKFPVKVRSRRPGDRFSPFGRGYECRLKKFLINCKIPASVRDCIPLLFSDNVLMAVGGVEVSDAAAVKPGDGRYLMFTWSGPEPFPSYA